MRPQVRRAVRGAYSGRRGLVGSSLPFHLGDLRIRREAYIERTEIAGAGTRGGPVRAVALNSAKCSLDGLVAEA